MADIIKKEGDEAIMTDPETRRHFVEELADVIMYLGDAMLCYGITEAEFAKEYRDKANYNLTRWD
jgi:hypothetical protein